MIKYVIQAKKNPLKKDEVKYYPQMAPTTPISFAQVVRHVEKHSAVSGADVKAVLDALQYEVMEASENGNTVHLGDLGSFHLTMKSQDAPTTTEAEKKDTQLIKQVSVQFTKSTTIRDTLDTRLLEFAPQEDIMNTADDEGPKPDGNPGPEPDKDFHPQVAEVIGLVTRLDMRNILLLHTFFIAFLNRESISIAI